jgi:hypothetical protein
MLANREACRCSWILPAVTPTLIYKSSIYLSLYRSITTKTKGVEKKYDEHGKLIIQ